PPEPVDEPARKSLWHADRNRRQAGGHERMDEASGGQGYNQRQRSGPETFGQAQRQRVEVTKPLSHRETVDMGDQRVEPWPALGFEDGSHRIAVGGVSGKSVDGFG